jgi:hypothetical protein
VKTRLVTFSAVGVTLYTVSIFGSQAMMSIGFFVAMLAGAAGGWIGGRGGSYGQALSRVMGSVWCERYIKATLLLVLAFVVSLAGAVLFPLELGGYRPEVDWVRDLGKVIYFIGVIPLAALLAEMDGARLERTVRVYLGSSFVVAGFAVLELFTGWTPRALVGAKAYATFGGMYNVTWLYGSYLTFATVMVFPFFLLLDRLITGEWPGRRRGLLMVGLLLLGLLGTMSRMLWLALPIGILIYGLIRAPGRSKWAILGAVLLLVAGGSQLRPIRDRLAHSGGIQSRMNLWRINFEFFKMRPVTGVGWHKNIGLSAAYYRERMPGVSGKLVSHAHSNPLEFLGSMGLLGLLAWVCWSIMTASLAFSVSSGLGCAWLVFHLNGLTQVNFSETKTLHMLVWTTSFALASVARRSSASGGGSKVVD